VNDESNLQADTAGCVLKDEIPTIVMEKWVLYEAEGMLVGLASSSRPMRET
jgi:hypothetical protein